MTTMTTETLTTTVTVNGKALATALRAVKGAAETPVRAARFMHPALAHVELVADPGAGMSGVGGLHLRTNGLENQAGVFLPAKLVGPSIVRAAVPVVELLDALKGVKARELVTLSMGGARLTIIRDSGVTDLDALGEAPPSAPETLGAEELLTMNAGELLDALERAHAATGTDETLPVLCYVHLFEHDGAWTLAATDRYRMSFEALSVAAPAAAPSALISRKLVPILRRALDASQPVTVEILGEVLSFRQREAVVTGRSLRADFPRVASLLPNAEGPVTFTADRASLELATHAACGGAVKAGHAVDMRSTGARFTLQGVDRYQDAGELQALSFQALDAEQDWDRMVNASFLLDMLAGKGAAVVRFRTTQTPHKPMLITRDDRPGWRGLLMPIRRAG